MMYQERMFRNIPAVVALSSDRRVAFKYVGETRLFENDGQAEWNKNSLVLKGLQYEYGKWYDLTDNLLTYFVSYYDE